MGQIAELRSDTFTQPTESMRRAMATAEVGDDVWDEDPTVHRLQELAAQMVGKQSALFVPSGTMGNLCAVLSHTQPGDEVLLELDSHIFTDEVAGSAVIGGVQLRPLDAPDGRLDPDQVRAAIRDPDIHEPRTGLLCLENPHYKKGGVCLSPRQTVQLAALAHAAGVPVHLDGARIFNAAIAQRVDVRVLTEPADSVMFCLSKGLSAPVGSVLAGSAAFVERARRMRKLVGGGMRQAGVLAAAGLCALTEMVDRLEEDHQHARRLADGLKGLPGIELAFPVETNMVFVRCLAPVTDQRFIDLCAERGVRTGRSSRGVVRMVTHRGVTRDDVDFAIGVIRDVLTAEAGATLRPTG